MLDGARRVTYANPAAENLFELAKKHLVGHRPDQIFADAQGLRAAIDKAVHGGATYTEQELELGIAGKAKLHLTCTVSPLDAADATLLVEFRHIDQQLKVAREERLNEQQQANRELIRNLAHEIKNPLGGIRGAAQLLEMELNTRPTALSRLRGGMSALTMSRVATSSCGVEQGDNTSRSDSSPVMVVSTCALIAAPRGARSIALAADMRFAGKSEPVSEEPAEILARVRAIAELRDVPPPDMRSRQAHMLTRAAAEGCPLPLRFTPPQTQ